jgi:hypothetical protein
MGPCFGRGDGALRNDKNIQQTNGNQNAQHTDSFALRRRNDH